MTCILRDKYILTRPKPIVDKLVKCHLVTLGDEKVKPSYCQREDWMTCTCCPQCCTCGG